MSKVSTLWVVSTDCAPPLPQLTEEVRLAVRETAASAREGLLAMSVATGLRLMDAMMHGRDHRPGRAEGQAGPGPGRGAPPRSNERAPLGTLSGRAG